MEGEKRKMKIIFLSKYSLEEHKGGGELNANMLINIGKGRKHDVTEMTFKTFNKEELKTVDAIVLSTGMRAFSIEDQHWILDNCKNVVRLDMDYGFCQQGNCGCFGDMTEVSNCGKCTPESELYVLHQRYLQECAQYVFLSPGHVKMFERFFDVPKDKVLLYVPFYAPDEAFINVGMSRIKNSMLWVGRFSRSKGLSNTMHTMISHPEKQFFVCGKASTQKDTDNIAKQLKNINNCTYLGDIEHDTMPFIYNLMEDFIFEGEWPDTGPTTILEAMLCGCNIIANPKIATILSNDFKNLGDIRQRIKDSKERFWNKIEGLGK